MSTLSHSVPASATPTHRFSDKRLVDLAWGLFLVMTATLWLMPQASVPAGAWLTGTGAILLALNAARSVTHQAVSVFTVIVGVLAIAGGYAESTGANFPLFAVGVLVVGAFVILRALVSTQK